MILTNSQISNLKTYSLIYKENQSEYLLNSKKKILQSFLTLAKILKVC